METLKIYKDLEITYQEFEQAVVRLGYRKEVKKNVILYINDDYDSIFYVSTLVSPEMKMVKAEFATNAFLMEMKGVLNDKDDIAKMIEQSRLELQPTNKRSYEKQ